MRTFAIRFTLLSFLLASHSTTLLAQNSKDEKPKPLTGLDLRAPDGVVRQLDEAKRLIANKKWAEAIKILHAVVKDDVSAFAAVERKDGARVHPRVEAHRLLGALPPAGIAVYRAKHEPEAKALLKKARTTKSTDPLVDVILYYRTLPAAAQAMRELGAHHLAAKHFALASLSFERLLDRADAAKESAEVLLQAVLAFHQFGDSKLKEKAWQLLRPKIAKDGMHWNNRQWSLKELEKHVAGLKVPALEVPKFEWRMFGGNPQRNKQSSTGGMPRWKPLWEKKLAPNRQVEKILEDAIAMIRKAKIPLLPAAIPVTATVEFDKTRYELVIWRDRRAIQASRARDGELLWFSLSFNGSLGEIMGGGSAPGSAFDLQEHLNVHANRSRLDVLFANSITGTLTVDRDLTYGIDDLPVLAPDPTDRFRSRWMKRSQVANELLPFMLDCGKLKALFGGSSGTRLELSCGLPEYALLGPPLVIDQVAYVLAQKQQELSVAAVDGSLRKVVAKRHLAQTYDRIDKNFRRRLHAAHLSYDGDTLVCPTNDGGVIGVDLLTLSPKWLYPHVQTQLKFFKINPLFGERVEVPPPKPIPPPWHYCAPIITDGRVVLAAPDDRDNVHCFDLQSGAPLWKVKRKKDLYVAGVIDKKVLLVGESTCRALRLRDGKELWELATGMPSGRGIASNDVYYLPLYVGAHSRMPEIAAIDVRQGKVVERSIAQNKETPGNLLFFKDLLISQTATHLKVYPLVKKKE